MIILEEERKLVKIQFNAKTGQCHVSIPRAFWDSVTGTGYLMATLQDGKLIYTPASKQIKKDVKMPKFLQENEGGESAITSKLDPSIKIEDVPDLLAEEGEESAKHPDWDEN